MFKFSRILIAYAIAVPLAILLGYLVVSPGRLTFAFLSVLFLLFAVPLFLKWHHTMLVIFWGSAFNIYFLPGTPDMWLLCALLSFGISFLDHLMFQRQFLRAPELTKPILFLTAVIVITAWYRGGIGVHALGGDSFGGKNYILVLGAIAGYFAFTARQIPLAKGPKMGGLYFLSGTSYALGNLIYTMGPAFYFLYAFVPAGMVSVQAASDMGATNIDRISGLAPACQAGLCFLLARYGIRGLFNMTKPWRLVLLLVTVGASFFAGFRSAAITLFLICAIQFYLEGLMRTHYLPIVAGLAIVAIVPIVFFAHSMPNSVQRALSFLPVNVDSEVLADAKGSSEWRFGMWELVAKEIPKYLIIGRGYSLDPAEIYAAVEAARNGTSVDAFEGSMVAGDYHSGPLSVIIPFGIFGAVGFLWVLYGGYQVLSMNLRFGDARLRLVNTTLLAIYLTYCIAFFVLFGALNSELYIFLGMCGLSVSLNGGVRRRTTARTKPVAVRRTLAMEPG